MANNRKAAEQVVYEFIEKLAPGGENVQIYKDLFKTLDDNAFDAFITRIEKGESKLAVVVPNFASKTSLSTECNLELAKELGHNFFERIWIQGDGTTPTYLTPIPYLVVDLPLRRQAQILVKKISIPEDSKTIDNFTGQVSGKSKGSKISYPEIQVLAAMGLDSCLEEFLKYRGGDIKGHDAMNKFMARTGGVSLKALKPYASGVESTRTFKTYLMCAHLESTL